MKIVKKLHDYVTSTPDGHLYEVIVQGDDGKSYMMLHVYGKNGEIVFENGPDLLIEEAVTSTLERWNNG